MGHEYKIGSFNMKTLGFNSAFTKEDGRDLQKIAEIIRNEAFDIVAMQELFSEGKALFYSKATKHPIMMELGNNWDFKWDDSGHRGEGYAFLWNTKRVELVTTELNNGEIRKSEPSMISNHFSGMKRHLYFARFRLKTLKGLEIRLICVHSYQDDAGIRKQELQSLFEDVYPRIADKQPAIGAYTILLGDYNEELRLGRSNAISLAEIMNKDDDSPKYEEWLCSKYGFLPDHVILAAWGNKTLVNIQCEPTTLGNDNYASNYDHFSFGIDRFNGVVKDVSRISRYSDEDFEKYKKTVSDHVPIIMTIDI